MQSKTSFFNKTAFRKNLTRFAPVWGVYTLGLVLGIFLLYSNGGSAKNFHFASNITDLVSVMALVNLVYAPLVAQLLFGDLYNSRMCNALHAMPLRRECWFVTNLASGMVFSLVPTAIMALISMPLLANSLFVGAWQLGWWVFLAANLQFACYFGIAVFAVMCVGNRFTMVAGYGLVNFGAYIVYWLIDTVYTPLLYGVITPTELALNLTPHNHMVVNYFETSHAFYELKEQFGEQLQGAVATFSLTDNWWKLWVLAAVGLAFSLAALLLYRKRDLECAGDAVAFRCLVPVFQVLCAIFVCAASQFFLYSFLGIREQNYMILAAGLVVGWFAGKMLLERTTRVFRLHNWYGLAALAAVLAVSLWMTHVDILGIETRLPAADKIKSVTFNSSYSRHNAFEEKADIEALLRLHRDALENRVEYSGTYVLGEDGEWIQYIDTNSTLIDEDKEDQQYAHAARIALVYELESGKLIERYCNVWVDSEAGRIANEFLNRWEIVNYRTATVNGVQRNRLDLVMEDFWRLGVDLVEDEDLLAKLSTLENARELLAAIQADCREGHMAQDALFHKGTFLYEEPYAEDGYDKTHCITVRLSSEEYSVYFNIFPDSAHTVRWLQEHGLLNAQLSDEDMYRY